MRLLAGGVTVASVIAMLLSALGLYAVISFAVSQRTPGIVVRTSLCAGSWQIANVFLGEGLRLRGIGMLIGLPFAVFGLFVIRAHWTSRIWRLHL